MKEVVLLAMMDGEGVVASYSGYLKERILVGSKIKSDFLFSTPSAISGSARLLDWGNTFDAYNGSASTEEADERAIAADWNMVGDDLYSAMTQFEASHSGK